MINKYARKYTDDEEDFITEKKHTIYHCSLNGQYGMKKLEITGRLCNGT